MYSPKIYLGAIWEIFVEEVLDKLPKSIRKRLCWLFGHRYLGIAFKSKSDNPDAYVSVADTETLEELDEVKPPALVSLAVKISKTRLIDNIMLE